VIRKAGIWGSLAVHQAVVWDATDCVERTTREHHDATELTVAVVARMRDALAGVYREEVAKLSALSERDLGRCNVR